MNDDRVPWQVTVVPRHLDPDDEANHLKIVVLAAYMHDAIFRAGQSCCDDPPESFRLIDVRPV